jgi:hypothetical protein
MLEKGTREDLIMNNSDLIPKEWSRQDKDVWNAWPNKNVARDDGPFVYVAKFAGMIAMVGGILVFLWAWNSRVVRGVRMRVAANRILSWL